MQSNPTVSETTTAEEKGFMHKLKEKWGLKSIWQVLIVLVVFAATGSSVVALRKVFFELIGFDEQTNVWLKTITYILIITPAYQVLLLFYGTLLGQFRFFWEKEKKMFRAIGRLFGGKKEKK